MPKITALTQGTPLLSDVLVGVDVTDTTMASTGTTKKYNRYDVDNQLFTLMGLNTFSSCVCATTSNVNATYNNGSSGVGATLTNAGTLAAFSQDGVTPPINSKILFKNQTSAFQNGPYILTVPGDASTAWVATRDTSADSGAELTYGKIVLVSQGTTNKNTNWQLTFSGSVTVGVTNLNFSAANFGIPPFVSLNGSYSLGGIFYSTATQGSVLSGTATASQVLLSGSSAAPTWSTATYPTTATVNGIIYGSASNVYSQLSSTARSALTTNSSGAPTYIAMIDGQLIIGSTAGSPAAASVTGSLGVTVTNGSNTISLTGNNYGSPTSVNSAASPYTVLSSDLFILVDVTGGVVTINMPNTPVVGRWVTIKNSAGNASTNNITVTTPGGVTTFDLATSTLINSNKGSIQLYANSSSSYLIF